MLWLSPVLSKGHALALKLKNAHGWCFLSLKLCSSVCKALRREHSLPMNSILNGTVLNNKYNWQISILVIKEKTYFFPKLHIYFYFFPLFHLFFLLKPTLQLRFALKAPIRMECFLELFAFDKTR